MLAAHRQPRRELARERADRAAQLRDLVAGRAHELQVFGERPDAVASDGLGPAVLGEAAAHLGVDLLPEGLHACLELVLPHLTLEGGEIVAAGQLVHQAAHHRVEVDHAEHAVLEVRAAALLRLDAAELRDGPPGQVPHRRSVAGQQGAEELFQILLRAGLGILRVARVGRLGVGPGAEVQVEEDVERLHVRLALDHRRRERCPEGLAVLERDVAERAERVDVLARRHRHARSAERVREVQQACEHQPGGTERDGARCIAGQASSRPDAMWRPLPTPSPTGSGAPSLVRPSIGELYGAGFLVRQRTDETELVPERRLGVITAQSITGGFPGNDPGRG